MPHLHSMPLLTGDPSEFRQTFRIEKLEYWDYHREKSLRICLSVSVQYPNVTDMRTDRHTDGHRAIA